MMLVTCLQMFFVLSALQLFWPDLVTGLNRDISVEINETIFNHTTNETENVTSTIKKTVDVCSLPETDPNYNHEACYAQGPLTLYKVFQDCPWIFLNGVMNILYYITEASLYREPAGIVLLVIAALASSFLINPFQHLFDLGTNAPLRPVTIVFGIVGAVLCVIERDPKSSQKDCQNICGSTNDAGDEQNLVRQDDDDQRHQREQQQQQQRVESTSSFSKCYHWMKVSMRVFPIFTLLSVCYSMWFVLLRLFNEHCSLNEWGYNATDQVTLPIFLLPLLAVWDCLRSRCGVCVDDPNDEDEKNLADVIRNQERAEEEEHAALINSNTNSNSNFDQGTFGSTEGNHNRNDSSYHQRDEVDEKSSNFDDGESNIWLTIKTSLRRSARNRGSGFVQMFAYRFLINARAIGYTVIANNYDLTKSYLELTLIRVLLSWMSSLVCILLIPRFILATRKEVLVFKDWVNLGLKFLGSVLVVVSLILMRE